MRLLKLKIRNLASLKGEHLIDFKEIQHTSALFAITGETGAGKSTILNSIALALYGRVYKTSVNQSDVVTLGERDGEAQLIFQVGGKNYLAEWRAKIRNQRTGEYLKKPETSRYIYPLDGESFDATRSGPIESTEKLLQLDFDQFCKCIILNQGEFAKFLSSSFTERKEILEKLYPGELLESLSRELKSDLDQNQKEKNDLDIELETLKSDGGNGEDLKIQKNRLQHDLKVHEDWTQRLESLEHHFVSLQSYHQKHQDNKKKSDLIKVEVVKETTAYNTILKESQLLTDAYHEIQKEQEREFPRLQELLKAEESLKHFEQNKAILLEREKTKTADREGLQKKLIQSQQLLTEAIQEKETHGKLLKWAAPELKRDRKSLELVFELFHEKELLLQLIGEKEKALKTLEDQGKTLNAELKIITEAMAAFPENLDKRLQEIETRRKLNQEVHDQHHKNLLTLEDLKEQLKALQLESMQLKTKKDEGANSLLIQRQELAPIETTLKLQSLMNAVEVCLTHPEVKAADHCPVCQQNVSKATWDDLRKTLGRTDFTTLKKREEEITRLLLTLEEEAKLLTTREQLLTELIAKKNTDLSELTKLTTTRPPSKEDLEKEFAQLQKQVLDLDSLKKDEKRLTTELHKIREQFARQRDDIHKNKAQLDSIETGLTEHQKNISILTAGLSREIIQELKNDLGQLSLYLEKESRSEKLLQEKNHQDALQLTLNAELSKISEEKKDLESKIHLLSEKLLLELKGHQASELIQAIERKVKEFREKWSEKEKETKKFEIVLKGLQRDVQNLDEHLKDLDLQYSNELHQVRELGRMDLPALGPELTNLMGKLTQFSLDTTSPSELFVPFKDVLELEKNQFRARTNTLRMEFASIGTRLSDWERKQDRINLLILKRNSITTQLDRLDRLYEVLGKDELRTFVLSLVEENLIRQTNDELQKLCQGRYEIIHQSRKMRMTPEFYILDKFREGGLRKVSTLSGGETFMVSLAMALALAEMTRGQAEIDSLFIDEGFGTLDQESLEDVLDMLQQIQTRGLMVGIISHIKTLTQALQVNLMVNKKADGTSSLSLQYN